MKTRPMHRCGARGAHAFLLALTLLAPPAVAQTGDAPHAHANHPPHAAPDGHPTTDPHPAHDHDSTARDGSRPASATTPRVAGALTPDAVAPRQQLYTCGMHPQVIRDAPGKCPICGMELTPIVSGATPAPAAGADPHAAHGGAANDAMTIDPAIVQNMGVRTATVVEGPVHRTIRATGILALAEPRQHDVNLRVSGWIQRLHANVAGMSVQAGDPLFDLYSPELQVALGELIAARRGRDAHGSQAILVAAATQKLELLGLSRAEIERLGRLEQPPATVTFTSPIDGVVLEKPIVTGDAVQAGMRALRIVDLRELWIDARVFEQDLPALRVGQTARVTIASQPGRPIEGRVQFVHPVVDPATRTTIARLGVPNPTRELRPGMFATVEVEDEIAPRALLAPREAVIDTGTEQLVFLALPGGRFAPRRVTLGPAGSDGHVQVTHGLAPGDTVVTSGQFLLDAESNMREALQRFLAAPGHAH